MAAIIYTARRSLAPGHEDGEVYELELPMSAIDLSDDTDSKEHTALSGITETVWNRIDETWRFTTVPMDAATTAQLREFLNSHISGEPFTIDPYGTLSQPDDPFTAELVSRKHALRRFGALMMYQISFEVRRADR